jgi:hypothetical protein
VNSWLLKLLQRALLLPAVLALLPWHAAHAAEAADNARLLGVLVAAYPQFLSGHKDGVLLWKDGTKMPFDDGKPNKNFEELLDRPSLKDMFYAPYPLGKASAPEVNIDPGRVRYAPFFLKMYGDCRKGETSNTLVDVAWLPKKWGKTVKMTGVNGAAKQLAKVSAELDQLPARFDKYLFPPAGTFNCRPIAGTERLSAHGAGIAIDISTKHTNYWQWEKPNASGRYMWRNEIPMEIVEIFEKHGFIWGGRWYHYDTMHFEYRPELIAAGKPQ